MKCQRCGKEIPDTYKFCTYCGYKRADGNAQNPKIEPKWENNIQNQPGKKKGPFIWILIGVLVLIAVAAAAIFFVLNHKKAGADGAGWKPETEDVQNVHKETQDIQSEENKESEAEESRLADTEESETEESETEESEPVKHAAAIDMGAIRDIYASSELSEPDVTHSPDRLVDNNMDTAWAEGVEGPGIGESVVFMFDDIYTVSGINIASGYQKNSETFGNNNMPIGLKLTFSDGTSESVKIQEVWGTQYVEFSKPVETSSVTVEITEIVEGSKWNDSCITEIEFD